VVTWVKARVSVAAAPVHLMFQGSSGATFVSRWIVHVASARGGIFYRRAAPACRSGGVSLRGGIGSSRPASHRTAR
jgi:hypothetical protein